MIYTITLNPSIDYVIQIDQLKLGSLNKMDNEAKFPGGKGINVSRVLDRLHYTNTALGFLGGFTGDYIAEQLQQQAINSDFISIKGETRVNIKLKSDQETEINSHGPDILPEETEKLLQQLQKVTKQDTVVLSGSTPPSLPTDYYEKLVEEIVHAGGAFVVDTTGDSLTSVLPYGPLLVKPNLEELGELFHVTLNSRDEVIHYGKKLVDLGAKHAIVSMAGDGALLFTKEGIFQGNSPEGDVKNSVGAGDSMIAGFTGTYNKTKDALEAFRMALAAGSATAFSTDLATGAYIQELRKQISLTQIAEMDKRKDENHEDH
ncbi:1-phosphofructokinase [Virgibacillus sp. NKC19-3]|uniref:1-phosphofructokinase n=1 Tax=Virgibacillus saliphilus TaxID=2831674 RepID=UPI001C9B2787|nr:1-phosphofructokinase [Virgibacillus sp. NKC19-3]MBY7144624.1 1-phosphofructokinase [Virgibacillus sp. NKC19-3]